jgi:hypothetical protein
MATKTITGLYETREIALEAANELKAANIADSDISIVAAGETGDRAASDGKTGNMTDTGVGQGAAVGGMLGGGLGLAAGLGALVIPGIGPVLALGWLLPAAMGAAVGASGGGVLGALIGAGVNEEHAHVYAEGVRRGGSLVTVRVDDDKAGTVEKMLSRRSINPEGRGDLYRSGGWTRFDETPSPDTTHRERIVETTVVSETASQPRA